MQATTPLTFSWYELMAMDVPAALRFYQNVFGWTTKDSSMPGGAYTLIEVNGQQTGGVMALSPEMLAGGARPGWLGYIAVDDVDAKAAALKAAGGTVIRPPFEIPGVIRFAIVADPHGAVFAIFKGLVADGQMASFAPGTPGAVDWRELHAGDGEAAWGFYSKLFGWSEEQAMDMGPQSIYRIWKAGGAAIGGMMTKMPQSPAPFWLFYVCVTGIDAAIERVKANGGTLILGPMEVPGGRWIANCLDPQGTIFAMVSQTK